MQPSLIEGTTNAAGKYTPAAPSPSRRANQAETAHEMLQILQQVPAVDAAGNQPWGIIPGYAVAAKTGNLPGIQRKMRAVRLRIELDRHGPGRNPQLVVAVNVQNPRKGGYLAPSSPGRSSTRS